MTSSRTFNTHLQGDSMQTPHWKKMSFLCSQFKVLPKCHDLRSKKLTKRFKISENSFHWFQNYGCLNISFRIFENYTEKRTVTRDFQCKITSPFVMNSEIFKMISLKSCSDCTLPAYAHPRSLFSESWPTILPTAS